MGKTDKFTPTLDLYARMVVRETDAPTGLVTVVLPEEDRQDFLGSVGTTLTSTPLSRSFCKYVVKHGEPFIVSDARRDERVWENPAVTEDGVQAYAGYPLRDARNRVIGSVCAVDTKPRCWTEENLSALSDLALATSAEVARRQLHLRLDLAWTCAGGAFFVLFCLLALILI